ncbi:ABC transporter substrate-binding protein [Nonomuraea sediminis]|uniref:ABC transporter substrate-binding protein n=1 Tax=Nonomuraea sediminis TaxID=2835864 RepID=UPI001BDCC396|nr:extracellular solute-binding protein [Nonomuraea sediminis]
MSTRNAHLSRRGFLGGSLLFVAGAVTACSSNPMGGTATTSAAKTTLNVWYHAYGEAGTQQAVTRYAAAFTKANPDIAVKVTWIPGDYGTKLNSSLLTADAPDVFEIGDFNTGLIQSGQIAALDDLYGDTKSDFSTTNLDYLSAGGKIYGIKQVDDVMMLYYRKSVLDKAGIKVPTTLAELADAAKALTTKDAKGLFIGNDGVGNAPGNAIWSNGGELIADGKAAFASPQAIEAVTAVKRLHDDKSLLLGFTTDWWDAAALTQNAAAMQWAGLWSMPDMQKGLGDDFGVAPWPALKAGGNPVVRIGGWASLVNAKGKNVEAAKKYVQWLWISQTDLQKDFNQSYGLHVPPRKTVAATADKLQAGSAKDAVDLAAKYGKSNPNTWSSAVSSVFDAAAAKAMTGQGDVAALLTAAAAKAQPEIDKQKV